MSSEYSVESVIKWHLKNNSAVLKHMDLLETNTFYRYLNACDFIYKTLVINFTHYCRTLPAVILTSESYP